MSPRGTPPPAEVTKAGMHEHRWSRHPLLSFIFSVFSMLSVVILSRWR
jgi:hypothetical protein